MKSACRKLKLRIVKGSRGTPGVSFLEFAIIALPLFMLLFGILEVGLIFLGQYGLDNATLSAARLIRTGQAQTAGTSQAAMITVICSQATFLPNCTNSLQLNVQNFPNFASVTPPTATSSGKLLTSFPYQPGGPATVNLVTSFYEWPLIPLFSPLLGTPAHSDGNFLLQSKAVFRTEPYPQI